MTGEEAIIHISTLRTVTKDIPKYSGKAIDEAIDTAINALKQQSDWIPVSERLPESSGVYIVTREYTDGFKCTDLTDACYFDGTSTWHDDNRINHSRGYVDKKIKAWMPLPQPYKAESEDYER